MLLTISYPNISLLIPSIESIVNINLGKLLKPIIRTERGSEQGFLHDQFISYELEPDEEPSKKLNELAPHEELKLKLRYSVEIRYKIIPSDCEKLHSRFPTVPGVTPNGIWLYDKKKDLLIYEYKSGTTIASLSYDKNGNKVSEEDYDFKTKEKKIHSANGGYKLYKNGILLEETEVYGRLGSVKGKVITRYKGGKINTIEVYDSNLKLLDKVSADGKKEVVSLGKEFLTLIYNHRKDEPINLEIFKFIKDKTKTKENYFRFEEQYLSDFGIAVKRDPFIGLILRDIRNHGLEISGFNKGSIEKKYGIKIEVNSCSSSRLTYTLMPLQSVERELKLIDKEMGKYPPGFIKRQNLVVYFFDSIRTIGSDSLPNGLYLSDVNGIVLATSSSFDHEFYHRLDDANGGLAKNNSEWMKLSPDYNKYGNKGFTWHDKRERDRTSDKESLPNGFARHYGRVNPDEDQATIAECLFRKDGDQSYSALMRKAKEDKVLMAKINFIKAEYKKWSNGMVDEKYFKDLSDGVVINEAYWGKKAK